MIYGFFYRLVMRVAHYYNWHYAPPIYPDGNTQLWCKWCGFRQTIKYRPTRLAVDDAATLAKIANVAKEISSVGRVPRKFWHRH